ncbi:Methyltransferase domain-containing protein [Kushneria avicenniae]|uniref:Methyltransferase domain-containing protein n=1 Tax=Kushneria avicenniae TaxID=402385 RepID=A0A1I1FML9_9GAMM|nr:methyltransferase domain-containing protein [Kushneria avicenniae]SFC00574.1 Methyltransferase domain-containing protein [Kushneria avicenniae]
MSNHHEDQETLREQFLAGQRYWQTSHGKRQWQAEQHCLRQALGRSGMQHALELGTAPTLLPHDSIRHRISWAPQRDLAEHPSTLICRPEALPLADEALELVLVHHLLEVSPQPGPVLREAARVTSDSGRLILIGWHPLGIAGPARLKRCHERFYQRSRWLTPRRLRDWLGFIDFDIERIDYCGFVPFENTPDWLLMEHWGRRHNLPLGRAWIISAKRQMCKMIPLKKRFDPTAVLGARASTLARVTHGPETSTGILAGTDPATRLAGRGYPVDGAFEGSTSDSSVLDSSTLNNSTFENSASDSTGHPTVPPAVVA